MTGYPLKVRAYRGVFSQWDYVYLYEAESRDAYLSGSSFHRILNSTIGDEAPDWLWP